MPNVLALAESLVSSNFEFDSELVSLLLAAISYSDFKTRRSSRLFRCSEFLATSMLSSSMKDGLMILVWTIYSSQNENDNDQQTLIS